MLDTLVHSLRAAGLAVSADDLRDMLWLAQVRGVLPAGKALRLPTGAAEPAGQTPGSKTRLPADANAVDLTATTAQPAQRDAAALYASAQRGTVAAGVLRVPGVAVAPAPADLRRALQPLARRVPSATRWQLDEEATATHKADTGVWLPCHQSVRERWFDLNLIVERSASMQLWQADVEALARCLHSQGGFRSVRRFVLDGPGPGLLRTPQGRRALPLAELLAPGRRPLTLLLTDTGSALWRSGLAQRFLFAVGSLMPLGVLQLLPQRGWRHTALGEPEMAAWYARAGHPNLRMTEVAAAGDDAWADAPDPDRCPVPMLGTEPASIRRWALATAARVAASVPCVSVSRLAGAAPQRAQDLTAAERVAAYRRKVSRAAYDLAVFLSVPDPLTVPVMRLVQRTMLPDTGTGELAEFFLGGLIEPAAAGAHDSGRVESGKVYRIPDEVRDELKRSLRYSEETLIAEQLSRVGRTLAAAKDADAGEVFDAYFPSPGGAARLSKWTMPFATTSNSILQAVASDLTEVHADSSAGRFLNGRGVLAQVRESNILAEGDKPIDCLLLFATQRQHTWVVFTRQALVLLLDESALDDKGRLVHRLISLEQAQPVDARVDRAGVATVAFGRDSGRWYYTESFFATPDLLRQAVDDFIAKARKSQSESAGPALVDAASARQRDVDLLASITFLIRGRDGVHGTGYLVAPKRIATAWSVVRSWAVGALGEASLTAGSPSIVLKVRLLRTDQHADAAVLAIDDLLGASILDGRVIAPIAAEAVHWKSPWTSLSYTNLRGAVSHPVAIPSYGLVSNPNVETDSGGQRLEVATFAFEELDGLPQTGLAGSPVLIDGALAGHLLLHLGEPPDPLRPSLPKASMCLIGAVTALLEPGDGLAETPVEAFGGSISAAAADRQTDAAVPTLPDPPPSAGSAKSLGPFFASAIPQVLTIGSLIAEFGLSLPSATRRAVTESLLLAHLAATRAAGDDAPLIDWYHKYTGVLQNAGWVAQELVFQRQDVAADGGSLRQAILPVLTAMLGPAVAASSHLVSLLNSLDVREPDDAAWVTLHRASAHTRGARLQLAHIEGDAQGNPQAQLLFVNVQAQQRIGQVLFYTVSKNRAQVTQANGVFSIQRAQLQALQASIAERVAPFVAEHIKSVAD